MSELRLVPAALVVWLVSIVCVLGAPAGTPGAHAGTLCAAVVIAVAAAVSLLAREPGQAVLVAGLGTAAAFVATIRCRLAAAWQFGPEILGTVSGAPKQLANGSWLTRLTIPGHPSRVAVFSDTVPDGLAPGATAAATCRITESKMPSVNLWVCNGALELRAPPTGFAAFAQHVRVTFQEAVGVVGPSSRGLLPGMILGDVSLQPPSEQQTYIDTGLSHLSAVSGSNVAIVTTAAVLLASACGLGLRARLGFASAALLVFAALVGPEPSVLRASVMGLVGMVAVVSSTRAEPIHVLCLAVIGLVLVDTDLSVHYGFALSVAATAGIVALHPLLYRALAVTGWPDVLVRALAVAIAADLVTMPIVALMAGQVSLVSVVANVLVAPVVAPVTVLGLVAVLFSLLPGGLEVPLLLAIEPMTWWVHKVAAAGAGLPSATVPVGPAAALVGYGWVVAGFIARRPRVTISAAVGVVCAAQLAAFAPGASGVPGVPGAPGVPGVPGIPALRTAPVMDQSQLRAHVVPTRDDVEPVPPGTELVVVLETGPPTKRPAMTQSGIPVIFPNRDGPESRDVR